MTCDHLASVQAYHDGELDPAASRAVEAHVRACGDCAGLLADLRSLTELVAQAPLLDVSPATVARYQGAWHEARDRGLVRVTGWLTGVAAAVLVGALALWSPIEGNSLAAARPSLWETAAITPPSEAQVESELVQVAQWMATDLSYGERR